MFDVKSCVCDTPHSPIWDNTLALVFWKASGNSIKWGFCWSLGTRKNIFPTRMLLDSVRDSFSSKTLGHWPQQLLFWVFFTKCIHVTANTCKSQASDALAFLLRDRWLTIFYGQEYIFPLDFIDKVCGDLARWGESPSCIAWAWSFLRLVWAFINQLYCTLSCFYLFHIKGCWWCFIFSWRNQIEKATEKTHHSQKAIH